MRNRVSILVANYNNGNYFQDCYQSIINQTYDNWEVIIIDDCSTDDSFKIINSIIGNDSRFKLYKNESNKGCGYTKRKCVEWATGEWCAFLDPDDALYSHAIERSVEEFQNNSEIIATYSRLVFCNEDLIPQTLFSNIKQIDNSQYFFNCPIQISHFFTFRRETYLKTTGINPDLKNAVDQDLYLKLLEHGNPKFIKDVLYQYRIHAQGISQQDHKQSAKESFAKIIHETMVRRKIKEINNQFVPEVYSNAQEIYDLIKYQAGLLHRIQSRTRVLSKYLNFKLNK